jgi:hypothetical protein
MKKARKRTKSKSSSKRAGFKLRAKSKSASKRAGVKSKGRKTTKAKRPAKSKVGAKVKRVAKKAAVAAGLAAIGAAVNELRPEQKRSEEAGVNEAERKGGDTSTR